MNHQPNPRQIALRILEAVLDKKQPLDSVLENDKPLHQLEARDRGFVRLLVATVLRRLGALDRAIDSALSKPDVPPIARDLLRLGFAQLHYLQTPPHAAISTTVDLANARAPRLKGLVNAVLRRHAELVFDDSSSASLPPWLWKRWVAAYGEDTAVLIAGALLQEPPLDLTAKSDVEGWAGTLEAETLPTGTLRRKIAGPIDQLPGFEEGAWWVQDLAASLPAKLLEPLQGKLVFDLCAAPGGKTAQLAAAGANVVAVDQSPQRLKRLEQNLARLRLSVKVIAADAGSWQSEVQADAILLDAPCLATGTIRRHPDIPYLKLAGDITTLVKLQARLLDNAAGLLKPQGTLIYCTCSLEPEEGERQIQSFLERHPSFRRDPVQAMELPGLETLINGKGEVRALPSHLAELGGIDGFFVARLTKK